MDRRLFITLGLSALGACGRGGKPDISDGPSPAEMIDSIVANGFAPAAGLVVRKGGKTVFSHGAGIANGARAFRTDTKMRVASVSKLAVALTAHRLAERGELDLDAPLSTWFGDALRHPDYPDVEIPLRHLMSHTSGLKDPEVYWQAAPGRIEELFTPDMWLPGPPGGYFTYCNFGWGILATVLERQVGERFDLLADRITLGPLGVTAGFNWSGVPEAERRAGATLSQKIGDEWVAQADAPDVLEGSGPAVLKPSGFELEDYAVGTNGTLFSPQGGLRASLEELCPLVRTVAAHPVAASPAWVYDPAAQNGDTDDGYFSVYGEGPQIHPASDSPVPGVKLIGHHGEAYGLYSGAWHAPDLGAEIAYAITGSGQDSPRSELHRTVNTWFEPAVRAAGQVLTR
ncbi:serine hydrolase domain-containing protein [Hyphomonas jannaschiana]|uniref:serine hydrolase domain-containing protein n=1 Tax=Hyphomonas jannaschiana TaxID=86 RepID=UPI0035C6F238